MFNQTFPPLVIKQLDNRSKHNSHDNFNPDYHTKIPFVIAYSNIRYYTGNQTVNDTMLSSFKYGDQNYILKREFNDFYQIDDSYGLQPQPIIKSFSIESQGQNALFRKARLQIQTFTPIQFMKVKKYFSVIASSIFFQYGNYMDDQIKYILPPIQDLNDLDNTYLDEKYLYKHFANATNIDYYSGLVTQIQISQDDNKFSLTVNLIGQGQSQMVNYAKMMTEKSKQDEITSINSSINDKINKIKDEDSIMLSGKRYITYNWIVTVLLPYLQRDDQNVIPLPSVGFIPQYGVDINILSSNPNILMFNDNYLPKSKDDKEPNKMIVDVGFIEDKFKKLVLSAERDVVLSEESDEINNRYDDIYGRYKTNKKFFWLGNVYFNVQYLINNIISKNISNLKTTNLLSQLQKEVSQALPNGLTIHNVPNQKLRTYMINLNGMDNVEGTAYVIPNFGAKSIAQQLKFTVQIPAEFEKQVLARNNQCGQIITAMFGTDRPIDINQSRPEKHNKWPFVSQSDEQTVEQLKLLLKKQQETLQETLNKSIKNNEIIWSVVESQDYKTTIANSMDTIVQTRNKIYSIESHIRNLSSGYYLRVDLTLDFIANIQFGHIFKLQYNPLGWETTFYVNEVKHNITQTQAQTTIQGYMFK